MFSKLVTGFKNINFGEFDDLMLNRDTESIICKHTQLYYSCGMLRLVTLGLKDEKLQLIVFDAS